MAADGTARYAFVVSFRLDAEKGVSVEPDTFETRLFRQADSPGEEGWLFFRNYLWHGALNDPEHARECFERALGVEVIGVEFRGLYTDEAYLTALHEAVGANLELFNAGTVAGALSKYLGSSIQVEGEPTEKLYGRTP